MTVMLEFEPELLARVERRASERHQTVPQYLQELAYADSQTADPRDGAELSHEEWLTLLHTVPQPARLAPPIPDEALCREHLYEDRS